MESNFDRRLHGQQIEELARRYGFDVAEVHCTADVRTLARRYRDRESSGDRHPGHEGFGYEADDDGFVAELAGRDHVPLGIANVTIGVDTSVGEQVDLDDVIAKIGEVKGWT